MPMILEIGGSMYTRMILALKCRPRNGDQAFARIIRGSLIVRYRIGRYHSWGSDTWDQS